MIEYIPYQDGQPFSDRYAWWTSREIGHKNENINSYALLIQQEYQKLINKQITLKEFELNTPEISEQTPLNYIRNTIIYWYPN